MLFCIHYLDTDSRTNRFLKNKMPEWLQISMSITSMGQGSLKIITINDNHVPLRLSRCWLVFWFIPQTFIEHFLCSRLSFTSSHWNWWTLTTWFVHSPVKKQPSLLQTLPDTIPWKGQLSVSLHWGIIITQELKLFPKHCCVSANIRPLIIWSQLEVSIPRESSSSAAASPDLSQTHSQECSLLSCCVLNFTVMFMPNNFFLTKW